MLFREYELYPTRTLVGVAGTEIIDLNVVSAITELKIHFRVHNSAKNVNTPAVSCINRIEIVDGGEVYWSLTGHEALAAFVYNAGHYPFRSMYEQINSRQRDDIPIRFGRYLGDEEFAFDPTLLTNPQLRITWANGALHTAAQTTLQVWTTLLENNARPTKALVWEEVEQFISAAAGINITNLPTDLPIRTLALRITPNFATRVCMTVLNHIRLDHNRGQFIPFDMTFNEFMRHLEQWWPRVGFNKHDIVDNFDARTNWMGGFPNIVTHCGSNAFTAAAYCAGTMDYVNWVYTVAGVGAAGIAQEVEVKGHGPETSVAYPFGRRMDPDTWFQPIELTTLRLLLTQAVAGHVVAPFLEQVRQIP